VQDIFAPRRFVTHALLYSMEPRIHHNILHEIPLTIMAWDRNQQMPGATPVTTEVLRNIARVFWGSEAVADVSGYEGKALAVKKMQNRTYIKESLGLCDFSWPIIYSENIPGYVADPDLAAKVFTAVTGIAGEEIDRYAERIFNLQRLILLREGRQVPEADFPAEYNFTTPLPAKGEFGIEMVPGPGEEPVRVIGNVLDRGKFTAMLKEYYRLRGWDDDTGLPYAETLAALGIADLMLT
jgi:aldehyde:ferredoxin oxidoreductase